MLGLVFWLSVFFVIYTYAGYPVLLSIFAKFTSRRLKLPGGFEPYVTLIITAYNEESVIQKKIENSFSLDYPPDKLQILIAADGSTDSTAAIIRIYAEHGVELNYVSERKGKIVAMNRAVNRAQGEIVVFSDANNMYAPDAVRKLVAPFIDSNVGVTTGSKLIIQDGSDLSSAEGFYWRYESWIKTNETTISSCIGAVGEMLAVRRKLYMPPPEDVINDDYFIVLDILKRGYRVCYVSEARSVEYVSPRESDEILRRARMTTGKYQAIFGFFNLLPFNRPVLLWQIVSHKYFRAFLPFGFIGAFLTNLLLVVYPVENGQPSVAGLSYPLNWFFMVSQVVFYAVAFLGQRRIFGGLPGKALYIPAYLVNSNIAVIKGLYGFVTKKQTNIWERIRRENV